MKKLLKNILGATNDDNFMHIIENIEVIVSKFLSVLMVIVILSAIGDLGVFLIRELFNTPYGRFNTTLFKIFGLFLNIPSSILIFLISLFYHVNLSHYITCCQGKDCQVCNLAESKKIKSLFFACRSGKRVTTGFFLFQDLLLFSFLI